MAHKQRIDLGFRGAIAQIGGEPVAARGKSFGRLGDTGDTSIRRLVCFQSDESSAQIGRFVPKFLSYGPQLGTGRKSGQNCIQLGAGTSIVGNCRKALKCFFRNSKVVGVDTGCFICDQENPQTIVDMILEQTKRPDIAISGFD